MSEIQHFDDKRWEDRLRELKRLFNMQGIDKQADDYLEKHWSAHECSQNWGCCAVGQAFNDIDPAWEDVYSGIQVNTVMDYPLIRDKGMRFMEMVGEEHYVNAEAILKEIARLVKNHSKDIAASIRQALNETKISTCDVCGCHESECECDTCIECGEDLDYCTCGEEEEEE